MKPYSEYSAEELAMERLFIRWVRFPNDPPIRSFWENWLVQNPHMSDTVTVARNMVEQATVWSPDVLSGDEVGSLWNKIKSSIELMPDVEPLDPKVKNIATKWYFFRWSAGVFTTCVLVLLWYFLLPARINYQGYSQLPVRVDSAQTKAPADTLQKPHIVTGKPVE